MCLDFINENCCMWSAILKDETQWLDQLEKKLSNGPRPSSDAEELSEELDVGLLFINMFLASHIRSIRFLSRLYKIYMLLCICPLTLQIVKVINSMVRFVKFIKQKCQKVKFRHNFKTEVN